MTLNDANLCVLIDERWKSLTPIEYSILQTLISHPEQIYSSSELYRAIWKQEPFACNDLISVHIHNIRMKIEKNPAHPEHLLMKRGKGYLYKEA